MCRLVAYMGDAILLEDILIKPVNSLIQQSIRSKEQDYFTNGDGFGVGWYNHEISSEPGLFRSINPAWNDANLLHLASKIKSTCFFGHVRAASKGGVSHTNCHPFVHQNWMFMHNGDVHDFIKIKRHLRHLLDDDIYNWIEGETDSEHLFALFRQIAKGRDLSRPESVIEITLEVLHQLNELIMKYGTPGPSFLNICVTDGRRLIASRFCTDKDFRPESMYYSIGSKFEKKGDRYHMTHGEGQPTCLLVASERINDFCQEWHEMPSHHLLLIDADFNTLLYELPFN